MTNTTIPRLLPWCLLAALAGCTEPADPATPSPPEDAGTVMTGLVELPGGVAEIKYEVIDGVARIDDMILGDAAAIAARSAELARLHQARVPGIGVTTNARLWPIVNGKVDVPYEFASDVSAATRANVDAAAAHWNSVALVSFRPRVAGDASWVRVANGFSDASGLGRLGTGQQLLTLPSDNTTGSVMHELGHTLGLVHEHQRADRDSHVVIHLENVRNGPTGNYATVRFPIGVGQPTADLKDYDFGSIMNQGSFYFSANGEPTITKLNGDTYEAHRDATSWGDRAAIVALYHYRDASATRFRAVSSARCLDVPPNWIFGEDEGVSLAQQFGCHSGANQQWHFYSMTGSNQGLLINGSSKLCLSANSGSPGRVKERPCTGSSEQRWALWDVGTRIRNIATNRCLDVEGGPGAVADHAPVNNATCNGATNQSWPAF